MVLHTVMSGRFFDNCVTLGEAFSLSVQFFLLLRSSIHLIIILLQRFNIRHVIPLKPIVELNYVTTYVTVTHNTRVVFAGEDKGEAVTTQLFRAKERLQVDAAVAATSATVSPESLQPDVYVSATYRPDATTLSVAPGASRATAPADTPRAPAAAGGAPSTTDDAAAELHISESSADRRPLYYPAAG